MHKIPVMLFWALNLFIKGVTMCKLVVGLEATSIFVSTISITAIALDRYQVILHSGSHSNGMFRSILKLILIWLIAVILALPLFLYRTVETHQLSKYDQDYSFYQFHRIFFFGIFLWFWFFYLWKHRINTSLLKNLFCAVIYSYSYILCSNRIFFIEFFNE